MKLFVKALTVIDSSYLDSERGMVGESYQVDVELDGRVNDQNMLLDFSLVKKQIKSIIDDVVDHKLIVPTQVAGTSVVGTQQQQISFPLTTGEFIVLNGPAEAYCLLDLETVSLAGLTAYLEQVILSQLPDNISGLKLHLSHEKIDTPFYHYSHGLKKHDGNCQRIAHGHRSRLDVFLNEQWDSALVTQWAQAWQDIYLGSEEDIVDVAALSIQCPQQQQSYCFQYTASQGLFELIIPQRLCQLLPLDTTIESLTEYLCHTIKADYPNSKVKVMGYEGIGKGAIVELD
ncbi:MULTISPECIES: 6-carboxytetrahydropterin synthase [unclassified Motilimonas]|uniref:6-carboxytetrahydropterin synthase n=1 Tax=Motilimonas TaxID=1914248 RepID=UPI001E2C2726|nr:MULTISPECIES: 6-carboxytetrahydropterin synthase [unclassified Motilimonas]MCE0557949.1 6-carboxytetrahydropterin synthase [Motilimonas sp. E26]MDO6524753.1 6-carboxytetrahydropterin synthase [Motilimonas sp. 1_MG-2023]